MDVPDPLPPSPTPSTPVATISKITPLKEWFHNHPQKKNIAVLGVVLGLVFAVILVKGVVGGISFFVPKVNYVPIYTLVNDKISRHGAIIVNLPKGVSGNGAAERVTFKPLIKGQWVPSTLANAIVYKPSEELTLGKHYEVALATDSGTIHKDFLVDEDPAVVSVFPDSNAEAELNSAITVVFNRPMVPLTTLSELESKQIPITITPATPGKFKWISTRTLQFIPDKSLWGSAHYTVSIRGDFVSMDGLSVPAKTYAFTTKQLRLDHMTTSGSDKNYGNSGTLGYTEPINFYFNQPIDLQKTSSEIKLTNVTTGAAIEFVASYGTSRIWDWDARAYKDVEDRAVLSILPKNSLRGHGNVWEFSNTYRATLQSVYPVGGDIALSGNTFSPAAATSVEISPVIQAVSAQSDKTELASPQLFDPAGTVTFKFFDDINIGKSSIQAKGLKKIMYGKKCEDENDRYNTNTCKKVDDKSTLIISFDAGAYARGEKVDVSFERLVNSAGFQINAKPIVSPLSVYPALQIVKSKPRSGETSASISELIFCTNVPLKTQIGKEFYQNFHANKYLVFGRWDNAYLQGERSYEQNPPCDPGQFVNRIHYGLLPLQAYTLQASVQDVFGQKADISLTLSTQAAPKFYLRFQSLQNIYSVTTPEHTKLTFATENFDYVNLFVCKVSPDSMVRILANKPTDVSASPDGNLPCEESVTKKISLKSDQWVNQYFQVDVKDLFSDPRGQYVLSFSHPQYTNDKGAELYARSYLSVTNLSVVDNRVRWNPSNSLGDTSDLAPNDTKGSVYWVSRMQTLAPESGARISLYQGEDRYGEDSPVTLAKTNITNAGGFAEFPLMEKVVGAAITSGDDSAVVSGWADTLNQGWQTLEAEERSYIYTDRPIYRPGQEVHIKGIYRVSLDGAYKILSGKVVPLTVSDSKGNTILKQSVPINAFGTFTSNVTLPTDAPLGTYYIQAGYNSGFFDVQEYVGAAFEAQAESDKDEYTAGESANISILGKYYFGVPLDGGTLDYSITSQDFYFDRYTDDYFNFGNYWYNCYDCGYGDSYLKSGKTELAGDGTAKVTLPLDFSTLYKGGDADQSKILVFHGTIKDKQGKSVSFQKSFIVHRGEFYLGVKADPSYAGVKQPFSLRLKTVDVKGKPMAKSNITVTVNKVEWQSNKRQEVDGGFYNRPQRTLTAVVTKNISTNLGGDYSEQMQLSEPGEYEIDAVGNDSKGNQVKSVSEIYIYGAGAASVVPTNNATLNISAEKSDVKVGESAKFVIQNPFPHAKALVTIERGRIFTYETVDINQSVFEYQFPVASDYSPNIFASVILLSPDPAVKYGQVEFTVDKKQKELEISVTTNKQSYLPGEKVNLTVTTKDSDGKPVPADVSIAVADVSVLALKGNPKKDPLVFFYNGLPLTVTAETNVKNLLEETPIPTGTKGGDGGNPSDLATKKRGEFKDTAFWQADVLTNAEGRADVSFTLPDNLTKWQVESLGITKDTKLGVNYHEIVAQKDVMAVPIVPRFIVPGDEFMLGAKIFNQTQQTQSLSVTLQSPTLTLEDGGKVEKTIHSGETATVYFKVKAPLEKTDGTHAFTLSAKNDAYNDTLELEIPITRNETYEYTATAGGSESSSVKEYLYLPDNVVKDRGGLTIKTSATLAVYLSDTLKYLFQYPYGCSEQLASKLSAIAISKKALSVENVGSQFTLPSILFNGKTYTPDEAVDMGLSQIYDNQTVEGGFSYYKGLDANPYLTVQVVNTLLDLKKGGYQVRQSSIDNAVRYLNNQISFFKTHSDTDTLILLAYTLSRVGSGTSLAAGIESMADTRYLNDKASSNALGYLALLSSQGMTSASFKDKVFSTLLNKVDIDSRGAYVKTNNGNISWQYYETPEKDTALLLKALVDDKREYAETDNLIRWLIASRAKDGSWGSTNTSLTVLDALSDYLSWKHETQSSFTLTTTLDETKVSSTNFTAKNILSTPLSFVPVTTIDLGKMHTLTFNKTNNNDLPNKFYYDLSLKYYLPVEQIAPRDEGIAVTREFYTLTDTENARPLASAKVGEVVRGVLTIISPKERHLFAIEDYIPAGFELVNFSLDTEDAATETGNLGAAQSPSHSAVSSWNAFSPLGFFSGVKARLLAAAGGTAVDTAAALSYPKFYPDFQELRDDRLFLFTEHLSPGSYSYEYYLRATTPGTFSHLPAVASEMYFPENFGRTAGSVFTVEQ